MIDIPDSLGASCEYKVLCGLSDEQLQMIPSPQPLADTHLLDTIIFGSFIDSS